MTILYCADKGYDLWSEEYGKYIVIRSSSRGPNRRRGEDRERETLDAWVFCCLQLTRPQDKEVRSMTNFPSRAAIILCIQVSE